MRVLLLILGITPKAEAFDPTTIAMGAQAVSGIMNGMEKTEEAADIGFSLSDLLSELGVETTSEESLKKSVDKLQKLNEKARDLKWSREDLKSALQNDLDGAKSTQSRIRALRNMIAASKRITTIMGIRPKAGEKALQVQEIRINTMILEELQEMRRAQYLAYLNEQESKARRDIYIEEIKLGQRKKL